MYEELSLTLGLQCRIWEWYRYLLLQLPNISYDDYNCLKFQLFGLKFFWRWFISILYLFSAILRNKDREKVPFFLVLKIRVNKSSLIQHSYAFWEAIGTAFQSSTTFRLYKSMKDSDLHMHKPVSINQLKLQILVCQGMLQCHTTPSADKAMHETFRQSI